MYKKNQLKHRTMRFVRFFLGDEFADVRLLRRNYKYYNRARLIFIHIPKCAGSSVSNAIYGKSLGHWSARDLQNFDEPSYKRLKSFSVIRDPVERARSAWKYCVSGGTKDGWVKPRPEYKLESFKTFSSFANYWLPAQSPENLDLVFKPQADYICDDEGNIIVDELILLNELAQNYGRLVANSNVQKSSLPRLNKNHSNVEAKHHDKDIEALRRYYFRDVEIYNEVVIKK